MENDYLPFRGTAPFGWTHSWVIPIHLKSILPALPSSNSSSESYCLSELPITLSFTDDPDNCPGAVLFTISQPFGSFFPAGPAMVSAVATDASANIDDCSFNMTVRDDRPIQAADVGKLSTVERGWHESLTYIFAYVEIKSFTL